MSDLDAIVIGAGYGGATCAALLAREGRRVLLVDKNDRAGGKSLTRTRDGLGYEMWPIAGIPAHSSRFAELLDLLGVEGEAEEIVPTKEAGELCYRRPDGTWRSFAAAEDPEESMGRLREAFDLAPADLDGLATMVLELATITEDDLAALEGTSVWDWVNRFALPAPIVGYLGTLLNLFCLVAVDRLDASEGVRGLRDFFVFGPGGAGGARYHRGGMGAPAEIAARYVVEHGGTFLARTRVERVLVEGGRASGVVTPSGEYRAPIVISNAGIQPTVLKLVGAEYFPGEYVERVKELEPSWAVVGARYFLDAPVVPVPAIFGYSDQSWWDEERYRRAEGGEWPDVAALYVSVPSRWDPGLAPDGTRQVVLVGTMSSPDPRSPMNEAAIAAVERSLHEVCPDLSGHVVKREAYTAQSVSAMTRDSVVPGAGGECIGLAQCIGQVGRHKPSPRTPLPGLYLVGCDAGGVGLATHQAVDSGFNVAALVLDDTAGSAPR